MSPAVQSLDHLVLTVADLKATCQFYHDILGMTPEAFQPADGSTRWALKFGTQKINLHQAGQEFDPKSQTPTPGSADLCFLTDLPVDAWQDHLTKHMIEIEEGPVRRTGASGPILSIYIRDPDLNLIEIAQPL
ncbi:MAG: VOC family protein [Pelagimonas sp.]|jgi:catechol 2,3-dioxygenase-like lactoylglutathione lyase family enzyme|nr:VOC family protein [Pelagimonas sp.]